MELSSLQNARQSLFLRPRHTRSHRKQRCHSSIIALDSEWLPRLNTYPRDENVLQVLADLVECVAEFFTLGVPIGPEKDHGEFVRLAVPELLQLLNRK